LQHKYKNNHKITLSSFFSPFFFLSRLHQHEGDPSGEGLHLGEEEMVGAARVGCDGGLLLRKGGRKGEGRRPKGWESERGRLGLERREGLLTIGCKSTAQKTHLSTELSTPAKEYRKKIYCFSEVSAS
jgi:hypothetical protein